MSDVLILGYYGFKNSGDDALLLSIIQQLKKEKKDINIEVLSKNPSETAKTYGVRAVSRDSIPKLLKAVASCRLLICGGGTLIQDSTSTKSLLYYLFVIRLAKLFNKKVMLWANGIGPLSEKNRGLTKRVLNCTEVITLRDKISERELSALGVTKPKIRVCADSVLALEYEKKEALVQIKEKLQIPKNMDYFIVSVREFSGLAENFEENVAQICDYVYEKYSCFPVFLPFQKQKDLGISERIRKKMHNRSQISDTECEIYDLLQLISHSRLCIGMRLHSLIYSALCRVPQIGLVYDPKVTGFMEYMGQKSYLDVAKTDIDTFKRLVDQAFNDRENIVARLNDDMVIMKRKAEENAKIAAELLR